MTNGASFSGGPMEAQTMSKSRTTINRLKNPHPGAILSEDLLVPLGISQNALARAIDVPPRRINEIVHGRRAITADTDLRLARYFGYKEGFFLRLQIAYDLMERKRELGRALEAIAPRAA
jgi:addiction module HigA family antidote